MAQISKLKFSQAGLRCTEPDMKPSRPEEVKGSHPSPINEEASAGEVFQVIPVHFVTLLAHWPWQRVVALPVRPSALSFGSLMMGSRSKLIPDRICSYQLGRFMITSRVFVAYPPLCSFKLTWVSGHAESAVHRIPCDQKSGVTI